MDDIKFITGLHVEPVVASETAIRDAIAQLLRRRQRPSEHGGADGKGARPGQQGARGCSARSDDDIEVVADAEEIDAASLEQQGGEAPIIRLVNALMLSAIQKGASDIHIEPYEKEMRIRFRIDGVLQSVMSPPLKFRDPIVSRIKIMARLDIAEKRLPQDGRIKARFNDRGTHPRASTSASRCLPTLFGEKVVLRLLDPEGLRLDMTQLGFDAEALAQVRPRDSQAVGHGARHRSDRQRQDQHALLGAGADQPARREHHDRRGSGRVQPAGHQPGAGARAASA